MKKYDEFLKENKAKKIWNAAVYVRLSKEDGDKIEWRYTCNLGSDVGDQYAEDGK